MLNSPRNHAVRIRQMSLAKNTSTAASVPSWMTAVNDAPASAPQNSSDTMRRWPEELIGRQVLAVVNFPPRQIANFFSEILVLGTYSEGGVVLIKPDKPVKNGDKLG